MQDNLIVPLEGCSLSKEKSSTHGKYSTCPSPNAATPAPKVHLLPVSLQRNEVGSHIPTILPLEQVKTLLSRFPVIPETSIRVILKQPVQIKAEITFQDHAISEQTDKYQHEVYS